MTSIAAIAAQENFHAEEGRGLQLEKRNNAPSELLCGGKPRHANNVRYFRL